MSPRSWKVLPAIACIALSGCLATAAPPPPQAKAPPKPELPESALRELTAPEKKALAEGFAKGLKDPASAQFQWAKVPKSPSDSEDYCGMVNAKNSYGGYVGSMPFMGMILFKNGRAVGGVMGVAGSTETEKYGIVADMCKEKGLNPMKAI